MTQIQVDTTVGQEKLARLVRIVQPSGLLKQIGVALKYHVDEAFRTRGFGKWRPLAQTTLLLRKRGGDVPLQDTGRYKQSFVTETDNATFVEVGTNLKVESGISLGLIHELGAGPYTIRVKRARVLAARTRIGGWLIFGKEVHHPGIPARPVLPTKAEGERIVQRTVDGMLAKVER